MNYSNNLIMILGWASKTCVHYFFLHMYTIGTQWYVTCVPMFFFFFWTEYVPMLFSFKKEYSNLVQIQSENQTQKQGIPLDYYSYLASQSNSCDLATL